ncbi:MAG: ribose 5-phosphate isomerase A [Euryarchaeota archaeon]|nr:ribose 5-phosphate isomerase A [Euryarchaeota archaeon]
MSNLELLKEKAGISACSFISDGMALGLGTGSTVRYSIIEIARLIKKEGLDLVGVPTSEDTRRLSEQLGIPIRGINESGKLDLTIDGADEFDSNFDLIKGGGGALTREKIVALQSNSMIVVADETKQVDILGAYDLPVEVDSFLWEESMDSLTSICPGEVSIRGGSDNPFVTDNGGLIMDCSFGPSITEPRSLELEIQKIEGVVEVGLFVGICDAVVVASKDEVRTLVKRSGRLK